MSSPVCAPSTCVQDQPPIAGPVGEKLFSGLPRREALVRCDSGGILPIESRYVVANEHNRLTIRRPLRIETAPRIECRAAGAAAVHIHQPEFPSNLGSRGRDLLTVGRESNRWVILSGITQRSKVFPAAIEPRELKQFRGRVHQGSGVGNRDGQLCIRGQNPDPIRDRPRLAGKPERSAVEFLGQQRSAALPQEVSMPVTTRGVQRARHGWEESDAIVRLVERCRVDDAVVLRLAARTPVQEMSAGKHLRQAVRDVPHGRVERRQRGKCAARRGHGCQRPSKQAEQDAVIRCPRRATLFLECH